MAVTYSIMILRKAQREDLISGRCHSRGNANRFRFCKHLFLSGSRSFRLMASGSRTNRINRGGTRSTCGRFRFGRPVAGVEPGWIPAKVASGWEGTCSIWGLTETMSWPLVFASWGANLQSDTPRELFTTSRMSPRLISPDDVIADGQRFLSCSHPMASEGRRR
jgi:hypothetical protein